MYTLIGTAKLNDVDPQAWLADVLDRIDDLPQTRLHNIHALHADFAKHFDVGEIVEAPWGMDELYVFDPSGSLVKFGQPTDRFIPADAVQEAPSD